MGKYVYLWHDDRDSYASNNTVRMITDVLVDGAEAQKKGWKSGRGKFGGWDRERVAQEFVGVLHDEQGTAKIVYVTHSFYREIMYRGFDDRDHVSPLKFNGIHIAKAILSEDLDVDTEIRDIQITEVPNAERIIDSHTAGYPIAEYIPI